ncbi:MAG TPA: DUF2268 domain-containing putative Zn-dependent protease [Pyrinomonadaceae bacterium]
MNRDPGAARLVTSDIDHFWKAYDAAKNENRAEVFDRDYFGKGSDGLKAFKRLRIDGCGFVETLATHPHYYASIRESTLKVKSMEGPIRASFRKLKALYDEAVFPDVYFLIGCMNSGGTLTDTGLLIGTEMYGRTPAAPEDELNDFQKQVLTSIDRLPHIVAHELAHCQQKYPGGGRTLLAEAVKEGSADFIAELISGRHINTHLHAYGDPRERELWEAFKREMGGKSVANWLYNGRTARERPADLGYYVGYKVCQAYYRNAADKKRAIRDILEIKDFGQFLQASRYEEKFSPGK